MMRKALAWVAAVTVAVLVGLPGVARATNGVWNPASCAIGSFGSLTVDSSGHYRLPTRMELCQPVQSGLNYMPVLFTNENFAWATGDKLLYYFDGPRDVTINIAPNSVPWIFGVCLMRDGATRVACVRVERAANGTVTSTPIGADDALVSAAIVYVANPVRDLPNYCATCVQLEV
jgi:hypothetical protein